MLSRFSCVQLFATLWTVASQAPLSMGILQARILEWVAMPSSRQSSPSRDHTQGACGFCMAGTCFTIEPTGKALCKRIASGNVLYTQGARLGAL